ncbi:MAG: primosomal protein DnaI [Bacillaceae bacterium]
MQHISDSLSKLMQNDRFRQTYHLMKDEVLSHPEVRSFVKEHKDEITEEILERSLSKLYEFIGQKPSCNDCKSVSDCKNLLKGYIPKLFIQGKAIDIRYEACQKKVAEDARRKREALIQSVYVPRDILAASFQDLQLDDEGRYEAIRLATHFAQTYEVGSKMKGLYLHGPFGVGKTYILGAVANELASRNISSMLVYLPEFIREMKSAMGKGTLDEKLEAVRTVPVLMLDDIGAEALSSWVRDEILGTILQYRMLENLPTFMTSNLTYEKLEEHLSHTQRGEEEGLKAMRIMERIKVLTTPVEVTGNDRRSSY